MALVPDHYSIEDALREFENQRGTVSHSEWLIRKWCRGRLSAVEVLDGARTVAANDQDPLLANLSRLNIHNAHRDLLRLLQRQCTDLPPLYWAKVPLWDTRRNVQYIADIPFNLPHEWLHTLATDPSLWTDDFTPEMQDQLRSWKVRMGFGEEERRPICSLAVWGDTAPYHTGRDSVLLLLWSCTSSSQASGKRHWVTLVSKNTLCQCGCHGRHTLDALWRVIGWSLTVLVSGVFPNTDHVGHGFSGGWRMMLAGKPLRLLGACLQFRGDWPWLCHVFGLKTHASRDACFLCGGGANMLAPLTDASSTAEWRHMHVNMRDWLHNRMLTGAYISEVYTWPGFIFEYIVLDWMHMVDLGCAQFCVGNILMEVFHTLGGRVTDPAPTLARICNYLNDAANGLDTTLPFSRLTLSMLRSEKGVPVFKGKAANTRHLVPIVLGMLSSHFPSETGRDVRRFKCLEFLNTAYEELDNWQEGSPARLEEMCRRHVLLYLSLAREAADIAQRAELPWLAWRWKPKHHMLLHLSSHQALAMGNPRLWWCYLDESAIGMAVDLAETVHVRTLPQAALSKRLVWEMLDLLRDRDR